MNTRAGYILVETLVSMAVLAITMMMVQGAIRQAIVTRGQAEDYSVATVLLRNQMARLELAPVLAEGEAEGVFAEYEERFQYRYTVRPFKIADPVLPLGTALPLAEEVLDNSRAVMGHITLEISWMRAGQPFSVTGESLVLPEQFQARDVQP